MNDITRLLKVADDLNIPVAFGAFDEPQDPPFACVLGAGQDQFHADGIPYEKWNLYDFEYYFENKDVDREEAIEEELTAAGFVYRKSEDVYIDDENMYQVTYTAWRKTHGGSE